jgi:hypothetical protein
VVLVQDQTPQQVEQVVVQAEVQVGQTAIRLAAVLVPQGKEIMAVVILQLLGQAVAVVAVALAQLVQMQIILLVEMVEMVLRYLALFTLAVVVVLAVNQVALMALVVLAVEATLVMMARQMALQIQAVVVVERAA